MNERKLYAVMTEYFMLCKMMFRIKATMNITWKQEHDIEDVIELAQEDTTFLKMCSIAKTMLANVF